MFEAIRDSISSVVGKVYNAMPEISKRNAAVGVGVVAAGAAAYFGGPVLAECMNPTMVCTPVPCDYWGTCLRCKVPETFCETAINSVVSGMIQVVKGVLITTGVAALISAAANQASRCVYHTPDGANDVLSTRVYVHYNSTTKTPSSLSFKIGSKETDYNIADQGLAQLETLYGKEFGGKVFAKVTEIYGTEQQPDFFEVDAIPHVKKSFCIIT